MDIDVKDKIENSKIRNKYHFQLTLFEGPLDLLLQLIEEKQLEITNISLAEVADQFMEHITNSPPPPEDLADFLIIACKLILIKSMALLPKTESSTESEIEIEETEDLAYRLSIYKSFKNIALSLKDRESKGLRSFRRETIESEKFIKPILVQGIMITELTEAFIKILNETIESIDIIDLPRIKFSISEKMEQIITLISQKRHLNLSELINKSTKKAEIITIFLAILNLIKEDKILVQQSVLFGEIALHLRENKNNDNCNNSAGKID